MRMLVLHDGLVVAHLRIREDPVPRVVDLGEGHVVLAQAPPHLLHGHCADHALNQVQALHLVRGPSAGSGKTWVRGPLGASQSRAEALPFCVVIDADGDELPPRASTVDEVPLVLHLWRVATALPPVVVAVMDEAKIMEGLWPRPSDDGVEHRDLDVAPMAGPLTLDQSCRDRLGSGERRVKVRDDDTHQLRSPSLVRLDAREARNPLNHRVVGGTVMIRTCLPETRGRDVHNIWLDQLYILVPQAETVHHARAEVLQEHVRVSQQRFDDRHALWLLEVNSDGFLVAIDPALKRVSEHLRSHLSQRLHADHVCTLVSQEPWCFRARQGDGQLHNLDSRERPRCGFQVTLRRQARPPRRRNLPAKLRNLPLHGNDLLLQLCGASDHLGR
mmetsp:Transcript_29610/g.78405  ORF Transcript_29610/g.78405 Transcript_29610/m.78405 type:complete len:388 (+) Transcript_29610:425-1588(+)